jgi:ATP-dependent DNA helicase RecQ
MAAVARGELDLVYVAPERLALPGFRALLRDLECPLLAIDEAHCISEWGHDFRPDYLAIGELVAQLGSALVLACTATATPVVRDEIIARLGLPPDTPQLVRGFARPNLSLRAAEVGDDRERRAAVDAALREALGRPGDGRGTAIVYAPTRRAAEREAARLAAAGWRCRAYHAGLEATTRDAVQREFMGGALDAVVATNAFGMGIDRPDVRAVVHLGPPGSLEAYYQEVGRAGRDGGRALGLLLFGARDLPLRRRLIESASDGSAPAPEVVEHKWNLFLELVRFAEGGSCRHDAILRYFGDEEETLAGCGICDVCGELAGGGGGREDAVQTALLVRKALSGVARVEGRFGLGAAVRLLRGEPDERLARAGLDRVRTFGILRDRTEPWLLRLLRRLVTAGWVDFSGTERPVVLLTAEGRAVMRGERPARVVLPPEPRFPVPVRRRTRTAPEPSAELGPLERDLVEALRAHRLEVSRGLGVPPYVVAHDRSLREIALHKPRDLEALRLAYGMGPSRVERFGDGILRVVARFAPPPGAA